jgi:thiol-disulfide isomerase/thioredoxin
MKNRSVLVLAVLAILCSLWPANAQGTGDSSSELKALVTKIQNKLHEGKKTEADLTAELKEFDALIDKHKGEKTDGAAQIVLMKAIVYLEVLDNPDKGVELVEQLKRDYPDTKPGQNADAILNDIKQQGAGRKIQRTLVEGAMFPDFNEQDITGKPLAVSNYKGKVVLIDFWAIWCGPCIGELPNVIKVYEKYHDKGFEIIGVSLDQSAQGLKSYTADRNMPWQQFCDEKRWSNKLVQKYGVQSIPATFLLDGDGKIIGRNLRGEALEQAVAKALANKN